MFFSIILTVLCWFVWMVQDLAKKNCILYKISEGNCDPHLQSAPIRGSEMDPKQFWYGPLVMSELYKVS